MKLKIYVDIVLLIVNIWVYFWVREINIFFLFVIGNVFFFKLFWNVIKYIFRKFLLIVE